MGKQSVNFMLRYAMLYNNRRHLTFWEKRPSTPPQKDYMFIGTKTFDDAHVYALRKPGKYTIMTDKDEYNYTKFLLVRYRMGLLTLTRQPKFVRE